MFSYSPWRLNARQWQATNWLHFFLWPKRFKWMREAAWVWWDWSYDADIAVCGHPLPHTINVMALLIQTFLSSTSFKPPCCDTTQEIKVASHARCTCSQHSTIVIKQEPEQFDSSVCISVLSVAEEGEWLFQGDWGKLVTRRDQVFSWEFSFIHVILHCRIYSQGGRHMGHVLFSDILGVIPSW